MRRLLLSLALAGCATTGPSDWQAREQAALDRELAGRTAGEPESCITAHTSLSLSATGTGKFIYREGRTIWINQPLHECRNVSRLDTLIIEMNGSRYCRGDRVRAVESGGSIPGPMCVLGEFVPYRRPS